MAAHVFHWKHGWIPLDHDAALRKAKGDRQLAATYVRDARGASGIRSRRDVALAVRDMPSVPSGDRLGPKHQTVDAAHEVGATDLLPASWQGLTPGRDRYLAVEDVEAFKGGSAEQHLVTDAQGRTRFTSERQALHEKIVAGMLAGHARQDRPEYHLMGGGPASGKSTMMDAVPAHDAAVINADDVKAQLPEYATRGAEGAAFTHEESSYLVKQAMAEAFRRKLNVTLDGTGDSSAASLRKKIGAARAAGYTVHGHYVTIPTDVAVARAEKRAARTGRHVPRTVIEHTHASVSRVLPQVADAFDTLDVYDNTDKLTKIASKAAAGRLQVLDAARWRAFLAKAG